MFCSYLLFSSQLTPPHLKISRRAMSGKGLRAIQENRLAPLDTSGRGHVISTTNRPAAGAVQFGLCSPFSCSNEIVRVTVGSKNLHRSELTTLQRDEHIAEWVRLTAESEKVAQPAPVSEKGGRGNEGGLRKASRELGVDRRDAQRAVKVDSLTDKAKTTANEEGVKTTANEEGVKTVANEEPVKTVADCEVHEGTREDAVLHAVHANDQHGLRRTNADKRRSVELLLSLPDWKEKSAREIAYQCGVSPTTASAVINSEVNQSDKQVSNLDTSTAIGKDGKRYKRTRKPRGTKATRDKDAELNSHWRSAPVTRGRNSTKAAPRNLTSNVYSDEHDDLSCSAEVTVTNLETPVTDNRNRVTI